MYPLNFLLSEYFRYKNTVKYFIFETLITVTVQTLTVAGWAKISLSEFFYNHNKYENGQGKSLDGHGDGRLWMVKNGREW